MSSDKTQANYLRVRACGSLASIYLTK